MHTTVIRSLPSHLPAHRQWMLLEWFHTLVQINDEAALQRFLECLKAQLPTEHMLLALGRLNASQHLQKLEKFINVNYPSSWVEHYLQNNLANCDPVLHTPLGQKPIIWQEAFADAKSRLAQRFIAEASDIGFNCGVTYSAISPEQNMACILSTTGEEMTHDPHLNDMLQCLAPHLFQASLRVVNLAPMSPCAMQLSNREYDIFHWMSRGKTNWEIATILGISERTVKFHVANIIRKLNANNRTHAIVLGLEQGLKSHSAASL